MPSKIYNLGTSARNAAIALGFVLLLIEAFVFMLIYWSIIDLTLISISIWAILNLIFIYLIVIIGGNYRGLKVILNSDGIKVIRNGKERFAKWADIDELKEVFDQKPIFLENKYWGSFSSWLRLYSREKCILEIPFGLYSLPDELTLFLQLRIWDLRDNILKYGELNRKEWGILHQDFKRGYQGKVKSRYYLFEISLIILVIVAILYLGYALINFY